MMKTGKQTVLDDAGFSLVELLVVLTILAMLAGVVTTTVVGYLAGARVKTAETQLKSLASGLDLYKIDVGKYPSEQAGLKALVENTDNAKRWQGPYIAGKSVPQDPWDHPYQYKVVNEGRSVELVSLGADNVEGGSDEAADIRLE